MQAGTLTRRLFLLTSLWAVIAVILIGVVLGEAYRRNAEKRFGEIVTANLYNLMGSVETDEEGRLSGRPDLRDPRFLTPASGWYWSVQSLSDPENRLASLSLAGRGIAIPDTVELDTNFQRQFSYVDADGQTLTGTEAQVFLGEGNQIFSFRVTGNQDEVEAEIWSFIQTLFGLLVLFGVGFVAASYFIVLFGLRPIRGAVERLSDIRDGRAERIEGDYPAEIQPLIDETNALIESNRSVIERARTQVGNLAHSLKTPLAVLQNEAASASPQMRKIISEQAGLMRDQVETYLNRARIAARHGTVTSRTELKPAIDRLVRVISKLNGELDITSQFDWPQRRTEAAFAGERQDFEEIAGNLLENAARFARQRISVTLRRLTDAPDFELIVEDDGPGMTAEQAKIAVRRGMRLDETQPGSGLGLSIVSDIAGEYGGKLTLDKSGLGGVKAVVRLPAR